jgi:hypothetical protein
VVSDPSAERNYFGLVSVRLYQTDSELAGRMPGGTSALAAYIKTLVWVGTEYFGRLGHDFGSLGILVAVGVKPSQCVKQWCEVIAGTIPADVWSTFVNLLSGAGSGVIPVVRAPIAFALETRLGRGPDAFPQVPRSWSEAAAGHESGLSVPDGLFELIFPSHG